MKSFVCVCVERAATIKAFTAISHSCKEWYRQKKPLWCKRWMSKEWRENTFILKKSQPIITGQEKKMCLVIFLNSQSFYPQQALKKHFPLIPFNLFFFSFSLFDFVGNREFSIVTCKNALKIKRDWKKYPFYDLINFPTSFYFIDDE